MPSDHTTIRLVLTKLNPKQLAADIQARWFAVNSRDMSFKDCIEEELVRAIERIEQSKDNGVTERL